MPEFEYVPPYPIEQDPTEYRLLTSEGVSTGEFEGQRILKVRPEALSELARAALSEINYLYRTHHLESLRRILDDPEASDNDRYVALILLKNAVIAADRVLPSCQDTGTAVVFA